MTLAIRPRAKRFDSEGLQAKAVAYAEARDAGNATTPMRDEIIRSMHGFAHRITFDHAGSYDPEIVNRVMIGFTLALEKYDPKRGAKYVTYAARVGRGYALHALRGAERARRRESHVTSYDSFRDPERILRDRSAMASTEDRTLSALELKKALELARRVASSEDYHVLTLYLSGMTQYEVADALGKYQIWVSRSLARTRDALREEMSR